tara:strand:+ start:107 stop:298 length:192 start_codon:yes stop_codon:yes gene_type:complete
LRLHHDQEDTSMGTPAPKAVQKRLLLLLKWYKWDLEALFPHNIDVWMRAPEDYEAEKLTEPPS